MLVSSHDFGDSKARGQRPVQPQSSSRSKLSSHHLHGLLDMCSVRCSRPALFKVFSNSHARIMFYFLIFSGLSKSRPDLPLPKLFPYVNPNYCLLSVAYVADSMQGTVVDLLVVPELQILAPVKRQASVAKETPMVKYKQAISRGPLLGPPYGWTMWGAPRPIELAYMVRILISPNPKLLIYHYCSRSPEMGSFCIAHHTLAYVSNCGRFRPVRRSVAR